MRHHTIRVRARIDQRDKTVSVPVMADIAICSSSTRRYHNCIGLLSMLTPCARSLLDYLSEVMDYENGVSVNQTTRLRFRDMLDRLTQGRARWGDRMVKKALSELTTAGLLLKEKRGRYRVNPVYVFRNNERARQTLIKQLLDTGQICLT